MSYRVDAFVIAMSQHYRLLKEIIGLKRGTTVLPNREDAETADSISDLIERIGGVGLANYCRKKFRESYILGDWKTYDVKGMLEEIRDLCPEGFFKEYLCKKLETLMVLVHKLSNPATCKPTHGTRGCSKNQTNISQMDLFPELVPQVKEPTPKPQKPAPKKPRKKRTKMDKLADEILAQEYGKSQETDSEYNDESYSDEDNYPRLGNISSRDYDYFSGTYED